MIKEIRGLGLFAFSDPNEYKENGCSFAVNTSPVSRQLNKQTEKNLAATPKEHNRRIPKINRRF